MGEKAFESFLSSPLSLSLSRSFVIFLRLFRLVLPEFLVFKLRLGGCADFDARNASAEGRNTLVAFLLVELRIREFHFSPGNTNVCKSVLSLGTKSTKKKINRTLRIETTEMT